MSWIRVTEQSSSPRTGHQKVVFPGHQQLRPRPRNLPHKRVFCLCNRTLTRRKPVSTQPYTLAVRAEQSSTLIIEKLASTRQFFNTSRRSRSVPLRGREGEAKASPNDHCYFPPMPPEPPSCAEREQLVHPP